LSAYARQFLGLMDKPDVDQIEGLSPAISIDQRSTSHNPRSTVGTVTEVYDYLRLLYARVGTPHCPKCGKVVSRQTVEQIIKQIQKLADKNIGVVYPGVIAGVDICHVIIVQRMGGFEVPEETVPKRR